ncbi:MAG: CPBP family intramembrane metalloprotease [Acidobacteriota bacterium]|nr:MAG: CPBP family intramembrane metalloprotease [Acidobacteriota bacterium]
MACQSRIMALAVSALLVTAVIAMGLLRSLHDVTPALFPGSFGSLLFFGLLLLLALHAAHRRRGLDELALANDPSRRLTLAKALPLLVVLFGEKWVSVDLLAGAYDWIGPGFGDPRLADAVYRLWTALTLVGVALCSLWVLRQTRARLARLLDRARFAPAVLLLTGALVLTLFALWLAGRTAGLSWPRVSLPANVWLVASSAQLVRGAAEELFYRGLIQTTLGRLLVEAGLPEARLSRMIAVLVVSIGFSLEHLDTNASLASGASQLVFVFAMSVMLGTLLEVSRNLYLVMLTHVWVNGIIAHLVPVPVDADGVPILPEMVIVTLLLALVFAGIVLMHRRRGFA